MNPYQVHKCSSASTAEAHNSSSPIAERQLHNTNIDSWQTTYARRKWRWAARAATLPLNRWTRMVLSWEPQLNNRRCNSRRQARPHLRWDDDLTNFIRATNDAADHSRQQWLQLAQNTTRWAALEIKFVSYVNAQLLCRRPTNTRSTDDNRQLHQPETQRQTS